MTKQAVVFSGAFAFVLLFAWLEAADAPSGEKPPQVRSMIISTDYPSINAAIEAAKEKKINHVYIPPGEYEITESINMSGIYGIFGAIKLEGAGQTTILNGKTGKDPVIDFTGSAHCQLENMYIRGVDADVGILMARPPHGKTSAGGHLFYNVTVAGKFRAAAVNSIASECNRFVNCCFGNDAPGADTFTFSQRNLYDVESPYQGKPGLSTNTELRFYGTIIDNNGKDSVGLRITGSAGDISIHGGYFHHDGFACIYMDGSTGGGVGNVTIDDLRIESNKGDHVIYATGYVHHVSIKGGDWQSRKEVILVEDVPSTDNPAHRTVIKTPHGTPHNWEVRDTQMRQTIWVAEGEKTGDVGEFVAMRFDRLQDSHMGPFSFSPNFLKQIGPNWLPHYAPNSREVVIEKYSRRNTFETGAREAIVLSGDAEGNQVIALHDPAKRTDDYMPLWRSGCPTPEECTGSPRGHVSDYADLGPGIRRTYQMPDKGIALMNLGVLDVRKIRGARRGDIAIHNGSGYADGQPRLAVYNGRQWVFFSISPAPGRR